VRTALLYAAILLSGILVGGAVAMLNFTTYH
jgi:hypothetical protein